MKVGTQMHDLGHIRLESLVHEAATRVSLNSEPYTIEPTPQTQK